MSVFYKLTPAADIPPGAMLERIAPPVATSVHFDPDDVPMDVVVRNPVRVGGGRRPGGAGFAGGVGLARRVAGGRG